MMEKQTRRAGIRPGPIAGFLAVSYVLASMNATEMADETQRVTSEMHERNVATGTLVHHTKSLTQKSEFNAPAKFLHQTLIEALDADPYERGDRVCISETGGWRVPYFNRMWSYAFTVCGDDRASALNAYRAAERDYNFQ